jgi:hypothetical protein
VAKRLLKPLLLKLLLRLPLLLRLLLRPLLLLTLLLRPLLLLTLLLRLPLLLKKRSNLGYFDSQKSRPCAGFFVVRNLIK